MITKRKLEIDVKALNRRLDVYSVIDPISGEVVADCYGDKSNADLIISALNACKSVNPGNPQTVAENIGAMYMALKDCLSLLDKQREEYNTALSVLPNNKVGEGPIAKEVRKVLSAIEAKGG